MLAESYCFETFLKLLKGTVIREVTVNDTFEICNLTN